MNIGFALINDEKMKEMNKKYLGGNGSTDVLAFPVKEKLPDGVYLLGEIVVNRGVARRQAREYKVSEKEELARLITHGFLHLLGFDDKTEKQRKRMKKIEDRVLVRVMNNKSKRKVQSAKPQRKA